MTDTLRTERADDAPASTSKDNDVTEQAAEALDAPRGDSLSSVTVTINRARGELYEFWHDFSNLPHFMENVVRIVQLDGQRSHWEVKAPAGRSVEWTSTITSEREGTSIGWTSDDDADVPNSGKVEFRDAPGGRGTWVTATILYDPPAGLVGKAIAKIFQREPAIQARRDLRRFKQLMETGEIATGARNRRLLEEGKN